MSFNTQAKLLRVLQDRKLEPLGSEKIFDLDVRVVTATNRNLEEMVKEGSFRQDLYYRLNVVSIFLPSLTERQEDIKEIALYLLEQFSQKHKLDVPDIDDTVWDIFRSYTWPGNIRELGNIIERALLLSDGVLIRPMDISLPDIRTAIMYSDETKDLRKTVEVIENDKLEQALAESGGNQVKAAMMLGIKRTTLRYKLQKYKLLAA
jgi:transcriptional regulator with PAS, ATPase and Fis domain